MSAMLEQIEDFEKMRERQEKERLKSLDEKVKKMRGMGDTQRIICENLIIFGALFLLTVFYDVFPNLMVWLGVKIYPHPYRFGVNQALFGSFCLIQFIRNLDCWRYHS